jgi:hypothetical protein
MIAKTLKIVMILFSILKYKKVCSILDIANPI